MSIAIIGTGISGLVAAHHLHKAHDITLFEANDYVGGHTATVTVAQDGRSYDVDTGFIVFNDWTYPNFIALLDELDVASQPSAMSFSVRCEQTGLEYNGTSLNTMFAQRRNLMRPSFLKMIRDILRFHREAPATIGDASAPATLGEFLKERSYGRRFVEHYLVPMGSAVWSTDPERFLQIPLRFFVSFFQNHGMLSVDERPQWRVVRGGSRRYVDAITRPFTDRIRLSTPVVAVARTASGVDVRTAAGSQRFDHVVFATHSDAALRLLRDPSPDERDILRALPYQSNDVVLHTDQTLMPRVRRAWAAWNYHVQPDTSRATVTYNLNILQSLPSHAPFLVTLNRTGAIAPDKVLRRFTYDHPLFTTESIAAQQRWSEISGSRNTHYCGAYWFNGFHEDGVNSALRVVRALEPVHA